MKWIFSDKPIVGYLSNVKGNKIGIIGGDKIGTKSIHNKPVYIEDLLGNTYIPYNDASLHAIYIPARMKFLQEQNMRGLLECLPYRFYKVTR